MANSPLSAGHAVGKLPSLKEPQLLPAIDGSLWLLWLEQRPRERGRTTAQLRRFGRQDATAFELTPAPLNLRSRVHDYGGGVLTAAMDTDRLVLVWVDRGCLWQQRWQLPSDELEGPIALDEPLRLTQPGDWDLADGLLDLPRQRWIGIREFEGIDQLVSARLGEGDQKPQLLHQPADFAGYACLSPNGDQLAWLEWQHPAMPWDASRLWTGSLSRNGTLLTKNCSAGGEGVSVFQPQWLPSGQLLVAEDSSGWWNLMLKDPDGSIWRRPWPMAAETALPQWVYGMRTTAWDGEKILTAACREGSWQLLRLGLDGDVTAIDQPFDDLAGVHALNGCAVAIASNGTCGAGLLELDLRKEAVVPWQHRPAEPPTLPLEQISTAVALWFRGSGGRRTHAWYYPPSNGSRGGAPLLVKSHSGPTAMAGRGLNLALQYWTSRGWGVVDVNYGGSTGFGRAYRERLNGGWGVVDVEDCAAAAEALIASGHANPDQIAIEGGSAGGFTTLACLCFSDVFRVGACRYAVCDLSAMAEDTHRFEARYLDSLVGAWPAERRIYEERSPLRHAGRIGCPVLFFQGLQDRVVPPEQTERMAAALRTNGIPVEVRLFEQEGHGFRDSEVRIQVLEETEAFFRHHLKLESSLSHGDKPSGTGAQPL